MINFTSGPERPVLKIIFSRYMSQLNSRKSYRFFFFFSKFHMFLTLRNRKRTINLLRFIILLWTINNWSLSDQEFLLSWTHMGVVGWFVSFRRIWNLLFSSVLLSQTNNWRSSCLDQCLQFNYDLEFIMSHGEYFPTSNSFQENSGNWNGMKLWIKSENWKLRWHHQLKTVTDV